MHCCLLHQHHQQRGGKPWRVVSSYAHARGSGRAQAGLLASSRQRAAHRAPLERAANQYATHEGRLILAPSHIVGNPVPDDSTAPLVWIHVSDCTHTQRTSMHFTISSARFVPGQHKYVHTPYLDALADRPLTARTHTWEPSARLQ